MRASIVILMLCGPVVGLPGCSAPSQALSGKWTALDDYVAAPEHERALRVARDAILARHAGKTVDYRYRVSFRDGEYSVLVWYVVGYRDDGSELMQPGGLAIVIVGPDYELDRIIDGH